MTSTAIVFFALGATVLWGGLITTLAITIRKERQAKVVA